LKIILQATTANRNRLVSTPSSDLHIRQIGWQGFNRWGVSRQHHYPSVQEFYGLERLRTSALGEEPEKTVLPSSKHPLARSLVSRSGRVFRAEKIEFRSFRPSAGEQTPPPDLQG